MAPRDDDRVLRLWTPRILRGALFTSVAFLIAGLVSIAVTAPASYVARYRDLRAGGAPAPAESPLQLLREAAHGQGRALLVAGLLVLTLVPIGRVAFAFAVFLHQRDWPFVVLTALVLAILCVGILLGRIG
jgi:uncharacterized membrane protein